MQNGGYALGGLNIGYDAFNLRECKLTGDYCVASDCIDICSSKLQRGSRDEGMHCCLCIAANSKVSSAIARFAIADTGCW